MRDVEAELRKIVASVTKTPENGFSPDDDLIVKYGIDSMQRIEIVIAMEKAFGVEVPDDEASVLRTLKDFSDIIDKHKNIQQ